MRTFIVLIGLMLCAGQANAGRYLSAAGFSIKKPRGWVQSGRNAIKPRDGGAQLNIRNTGAMPLTPAAVRAIRKQLMKVYRSKFRNFHITSFGKRTFGPNRGIYVRARLRVRNIPMVMSQAFLKVRHAKRMLIVTCMVRADKRRAHLGACEATYRTARAGRR